VQRVQYLMKIGVAGVLALVVVPPRAEESRRGRQRTWRGEKSKCQIFKIIEQDAHPGVPFLSMISSKSVAP
jgi:hypothetical protein